jgi:hypothetical protein
MSRSVLLSRVAAAGGPTPLQLWDLHGELGFVVPEGGWSPGASTMRRGTVSGQYTRSRQLVDAVEDTRNGLVTVVGLAADGAGLTSMQEVLRKAFRQWTYTLDWDYDGYVAHWTCEPADIAIAGGGSIDEDELAFHWMRWTFTIPYSTTDGRL